MSARPPATLQEILVHHDLVVEARRVLGSFGAAYPTEIASLAVVLDHLEWMLAGAERPDLRG